MFSFLPPPPPPPRAPPPPPGGVGGVKFGGFEAEIHLKVQREIFNRYYRIILLDRLDLKGGLCSFAFCYPF